MASTYLTRTPSSTGSQTKFTFSCWLKKCSIGVKGALYSCGNATNANYYTDARFSTEDKLTLNWYDDNGNHTITTNQLFRDSSAFYNIVIAWDTTQATASNRVKIYVNGTQITSFSNADYVNQNQAMLFNTVSKPIDIGRRVNNTDYLNGILSHVHGIDGTAYDASAFGSTDATTGEWKINTSPSVTYGTNGFFILKDGNSVTDQSGNSNNFTVGGGTLTKTEDNPSNVFATLNPLFHKSEKITFSNGNNTASEPSGNSTSWTTRWGISSIGFSSGKFYAEAKISDYGSGQLYPIGIVRDENIPNIDSSIGSNGWGYYTLASGGGTIIGSEDGTNLQTSLGASTTGDIIGLAVDADNNTLQFYKNGSTLGSQVTGITAGTYFIGCNAYANFGIQMNFGNGYFGTTAVSSAGTNASGIGIFEYDVPNGFTALSTKGLNE